jgi:hypothetical protein
MYNLRPNSENVQLQERITENPTELRFCIEVVFWEDQQVLSRGFSSNL